jgi:hypothetical protein
LKLACSTSLALSSLARGPFFSLEVVTWQQQQRQQQDSSGYRHPART